MKICLIEDGCMRGSLSGQAAAEEQAKKDAEEATALAAYKQRLKEQKKRFTEENKPSSSGGLDVHLNGRAHLRYRPIDAP